MNRLQLILAAATLPYALTATAQSDEQFNRLLSMSLEDLMKQEVTISTAMPQPLANAPGMVTVITADDFKATGATNLVEMLETVPGIHIRTDKFLARPLIEIRGANATQTLLMVNGVPMRDLMWGFGIFWGGLPASTIDRVEVIRGPGSALYGADASAGVINVITKHASTIDNDEVGVRLGSFNSRSAWLQHGSDWSGYRIGLTANLSTTDGYAPHINEDRQTGSDLTDGTNVSYAPADAEYGKKSLDLRLGIAKGKWRLNSSYVALRDARVGLTGFGVLDPESEVRDSRLNIDLFYNDDQAIEDWAIDAALRFQHYDYSSGNGFFERPPGFAGTYPDGQVNQMESAERRTNLELSGLYSGIDAHRIRIGGGYTLQDLYRVEQRVNFGTGPDGNPLPAGGPLVDLSDTPYAFAPEQERKISYLFLQDVWSLDEAWELTAGARYDNYSDFGDTLNPRLALVWQANDRLTAKLMYGQAFRAPSYQELFAETSFSLPNADLDPERSESYDLSLTYTATNRLYLTLNLFQFNQSDIIRLTDAGLGKLQYNNAGSHTIDGYELEAHWQATESLRLTGNYTYRDQENTPYRAIGQPDQDGYLRGDWRILPGWNWNLQANWLDEQLQSSSDASPAMDEQWVVDTTLRHQTQGNWELAASIRNLTDSDARIYAGTALADDLPLPERNYYAEARYKF